MKTRLILVFIGIVCVLGNIDAKQRDRRMSRRVAVDSMAILNAYADSLRMFEHKYDSLLHVHDSLKQVADGDGRLYRLFSPLTFFHSSAKKNLSIFNSMANVDEVDDEVDNVLMNIYLKRPDLVRNSETKLKDAGKIRNDVVDKKVKVKNDIVERVEVKPEDKFLPAPTMGIVIMKPKFWTYNGNGNLQFIQNYVSGNWYKGGESNYSMVGDVTLNANYNNKSRLKFENKLELKLGFQTSRGDTLHKFKTNNDLIRYTGKLGLQAHKQWYYTLQLLAYTQFTQGLKSNDKKVYSDFMSPFNVNLGVGLDYTIATKNNRLKGNVNMSFLSFNFRYVDRRDLWNSYKTGNHHTLEEFGSQLTANAEWKISEQVSWKTRLYWYTSYKRTQIEWENTFAIRVSRYISAHIFMYPRFDDHSKYDDKLGYFQFQEYCSLGLGYSF